MLLKPVLDYIAVVHFQIVENQECFLLGIFERRSINLIKVLEFVLFFKVAMAFQQNHGDSLDCIIRVLF